jgi:hypothetical protein
VNLINRRNPTIKVRVLALASTVIALWVPVNLGAQQRTTIGKDVTRIEGLRWNPVAVPDDPEATYEGARVVFNVEQDGLKGMRVHAKFRVRYGKNNPCQLIAYFYYKDGTPLRSNDRNYRDKSGHVSAHTNFTPAYDPAEYSDLEIFVPYRALNLEGRDDATYELKFYLALYDKDGERFFGKSGWYYFHYTAS